jgi:predicted unusual protein kinase regulating ubiquinone biosynthesis (AarF/ABC1/UbiB family)
LQACHAELLLADAAERSRFARFMIRIRRSFRLGAWNGDPHPGNYLFGGDGRMTFLTSAA